MKAENAAEKQRSGEKVRVGVLGCGARMAGILHRLAKVESGVVVTKVYDPREAAFDNLRVQLESANAPVVFEKAPDVEAVVSADDVDWVFIGSWNCQHKEHVLAAARFRKPIFCEKPLVTHFADCMAVRDAVKEADIPFSMGFVLRYSPFYQRIRELLDEGVVGKIVSFEFNETLDFNHGGYIHGNWRRLRQNAGTHILEKCCHDIDLANWLVGSLPVKAASFGGLDIFRKENASLKDKIGPSPSGVPAFRNFVWEQRDYLFAEDADPFETEKDILDNQVVIMEYANGVRASFHTNCSTGIAERRFYICGTEGAIRGDVREGVLEWKRTGWNRGLTRERTVSGGHGGGDDFLAVRLGKSLLEGAAPAASLYDGMVAAISCFGIDIAQDTGQVCDLSPMWKEAEIDPLVFAPEGQIAGR